MCDYCHSDRQSNFEVWRYCPYCGANLRKEMKIQQLKEKRFTSQSIEDVMGDK